jgi:Ca2+-transporting ATPase
MATELGRLADLLQGQPTGPTPLQRRLAVLGRWMAMAALAVCAVGFAVGVDRDGLARDHPRVAEVAFDATRRRMTTLHQRPDGVWVAVKGAVDALVPLLDPADAALAEEARTVAGRWAADGYRILALADRRLPAGARPTRARRGRPPPARRGRHGRPAAGRIGRRGRRLRRAGVTPVMITGDDARTASAIAGRVGILDDGDVLTGAELACLDEGGLAERVAGTRVFARTSPSRSCD